MGRKEKDCAYWIGVLLAGIVLGAVGGFVFGWLWKEGPTSSEATKLVDVFIAIGTVGATALSLFFWYLQNKKQSQLIKKEALSILANQNRKIIDLIRGVTSARYSNGGGAGFASKGQKQIAALLVPSNDLVDMRYNKLLSECGNALAYAEMRASEGESIEETLRGVQEKLGEVQAINIKCWKELGYYWIRNEESSLVAEHAIPANYWLS